MNINKYQWKDSLKQHLPGFLQTAIRGIIAIGRPKIFYTKESFIQKSPGRSAIPASFNYEKTTPLCRLMKEQGTDKALFQGTSRHNYTTFYYRLFKKIRYKGINLFELGIGTTDPSIAANMGSNGVPGASLRGWKKFFPAGNICGADIDRNILFEDGRVRTFYCDQTDPFTIKHMWKEEGMPACFDIIIDDGLHEFEANRCFLENALQKLKTGGIYIIEDVLEADIPKWKEYLPEQAGLYPDLNMMVLSIPNKFNNWDNNLIVLEKQLSI